MLTQIVIVRLIVFMAIVNLVVICTSKLSKRYICISSTNNYISTDYKANEIIVFRYKYVTKVIYSFLCYV